MIQYRDYYRERDKGWNWWKQWNLHGAVRAAWFGGLHDEFGTRKIPAQQPRTFLVGRATYDWDRLANVFNENYGAVERGFHADFELPKPRFRNLYCALVCEVPGILRFAQELGIAKLYSIGEEHKLGMYLHYHRLLVMPDCPSWQFKRLLITVLILALWHKYFDATWHDTWAILGYSRFLFNRLMHEPIQLEKKVAGLAQSLLEAERAGDLMSIRELVATVSEPTEEQARVQRYLDLAHLFIYFLRERATEYGMAWRVVQAHIQRDVDTGEEVVSRLEAGFNLSLDEITRCFLDWCADKASAEA